MFLRFLTFFFLLAMPYLGHAQPLPDRHPITGVAVDGAGKPVPGAYISLRRQDGEGSFAFWGAATATDGRGEFRFLQAETGRYYMNVEIEGFAPIYNSPVIWKPGAAPLKVKLERLIDLTLSLSLPDGAPAKNLVLWVRLRGDGYAGQVTRRVQTNGEGKALLDDLQPANYSMLLSSSAGYVFKDRLALRSDGTQQLRLEVGGTLRVNVAEVGVSSRGLGGASLALVPQDQDEAGRLLGEAANTSEDFAAMAAMGKRLTLVSRDGDGSIAIASLPPGRYLAKLTGANFQVTPPRPITIAAGQTETVTWSVVPKAATKASLEMQLNDEEGKPLSGAFEIRVLPLAANGSLLAGEISDDAPGGNGGRRGLADASGRLTLYPLAPGRYRFFVSRARPAELNPETAEAPSFDVTVAASGTTATLVLKREP